MFLLIYPIVLVLLNLQGYCSSPETDQTRTRILDSITGNPTTKYFVSNRLWSTCMDGNIEQFKFLVSDKIFNNCDRNLEKVTLPRTFLNIWLHKYLSISSCKKGNKNKETEFLNLYIFATRCCRPLIFQTMNSVRPNSQVWNIKG